VPLFERVPRGVELTPAGRAFLPEARLTLAQAERAQRSAQRAAMGETGRLRVGFVEAATHSGILPDVLSFFRAHLPSVGLSLFELDPLRQGEAFQDGRIDVGILHSPPLDAARWLRVEPIYTEPVILALPKTHALADRSRLTLASLADESFVSIPRVTAPEMFDDIISSCRRAGFSPRIVQEAAGWHTLASLVGAGVGVGVVPRSIAEFQQAAVVYRSVRGLGVEMSLAAVWKRSERSPVRERFVTALKAVAGARAGGVG
jgi:DNA-binding transcriptional LysR family regulator